MRFSACYFSLRLLLPLLLLVFCLAHFTVFAAVYELDEIVVTDTVTPVDARASGTGVIVISSEEISDKNPATLDEVLRSVPVLSVYNTGPNAVSVGIRGAASGHTLILVDGIPVSDPSGMSGSAGIATIAPSSIERIEIVTGPASAMYGSGAMSGVINIITKKDAPSSLYANAGSYGAYSFGGVLAVPYFNIGAGYYKEDGISMAAERLGNTEKDSYNTKYFFVRHKLDEGLLHQDFNLDYSEDFVNTDNDIYDDFSDTTDKFTRVNYKLGYDATAWWTPFFGIGTVQSKRFYNSPLWGLSSYTGITKYAEMENIFRLSYVTISFGGKYAEDQAESSFTTERQKADMREVFLNAHATPLDGWNIFAGGRYTDIDHFTSRFTYSANTSYLIQRLNLTLKGGYGTGFKAPTLDQLYNPQWGTSELKAQLSDTFEIGFTHGLFDDRFIWGLTWFSSEYDDQISYSYTDGFYNIDSSNSGIEAQATAYIMDFASLNLSYTYADMEERQGGVSVKPQRRPYNKASAMLSIYPMDSFSATIEAIYTDKVHDTWFDQSYAANDTTLAAYTLVNMYLSYDVYEWLNINAKALNITDEAYEAVYGYGTKGFEVHGGVKVRW